MAVKLVKTVEGMPVWLVTGYREVRQALADRRLCQNAARAQRLADQMADGVDLGSDVIHMLNSDPPDHTRLRRVMSGAFSTARVTALRPRIEEIADELLDRMGRQSESDLIRDYAFPLPVTVICELLGVPADDRSLFRDWSTALLTHERSVAAQAAITAMRDYLERLLAHRGDGDDLLSELVRARQRGQLGHDEVVAMAILLLIAGHETTVGLIGNAVLVLLRHPQERAELEANPDRLPDFLEEVLRLESPVAMAPLRFTTAEVRLGEVDVPAGQFVLLALGAANRDPHRFSEPDSLRLGRSHGHLAFGHGIHRCLGAALARVEGDIALRRLLIRYPGLSLVGGEDDLHWRDTPMLRGLESLPVTLGCGSGSSG